MPVVIAGTHFAQNLAIRLTQVKFGQYFQVPVINAGTHFAQNLENRPPPPNEQPVAEGDGLRVLFILFLSTERPTANEGREGMRLPAQAQVTTICCNLSSFEPEQGAGDVEIPSFEMANK